MMKLQEVQKKFPLSDFPIFSGSNVESCRQALSRIFNPVFLEPDKKLKSFQVSVHGVQLPYLWLCSLSYLGTSELGPIEPSNYHTLQVIPSGNIRFDIDGRKIKANAAQALMVSNDQRVRLYPTDNSRCLSLVVKDNDLRDVISLWVGHSKIPKITFNKRLTMTNPGVSSFLSYFHTIIDTLDRNSNLLRMPAAVASLENMLITFMLFELEHNLGDFFTASCAEAGTNQIRDVEEYMEANCSKAINIKVLTQVTGHSARSIYRAFQKHRDYTPMEFLKHIRMRLARQKLLHGTLDSMVTTIVYECGFTHLGRFSTEYKCCYGEKPSETLRQSLREKGLSSQERNENR